MSTPVFNTPESLRAAVGQTLGTSAWLPITQERVQQFADATDDHQWIHLDPERAAQGPFGACIAHGYLTLSLLPRFMAEIMDARVRMGVNYGLNKLRFPAPVRVGSRIRGRGELLAVEMTGDGAAQATVQVTVDIEGEDKPACVAEALFRYYF